MPSTVDMCKEAIAALRDRTGSSRHAIKAYILAKFGLEPTPKALTKALSKGDFVKNKGSYKLTTRARSQANAALAAASRAAASRAGASWSHAAGLHSSAVRQRQLSAARESRATTSQPAAAAAAAAARIDVVDLCSSDED